MKKRTPSYFIMAHTRRMRREVLSTRRKEKLKAERRRENALKAASVYQYSSDEGRMVASKHYEKLTKTPCPKNVCLDTNPEETIKFLRKIPSGDDANRRLRRRSGRKAKTSKIIERYFDFESIENICPASALIISSSYFMHKMRGGRINVIRWKTWNQGVKHILRKMGFFELLKFKHISTDESLQDIPIKGFKMGREASNEKITQYFKRLIKKVSKTFDINENDPSFKKTMYAIQEAVENTARHAYTDSYPNDVSGGWWFGGMPIIDKKQITFVCYDKGRSIPQSIKESHLEPEKRVMHDFVNGLMDLKAMRTGIPEVKNNRDHERLEEAMKYLASSTGKKGGGKGLSHIVSTVDNFEYGSKVRIMSRRAYAVITKGKEPVVTLLKTPIVGTLIVWDIKVI